MDILRRMKSTWDVAIKRVWANFELSYECWDGRFQPAGAALNRAFAGLANSGTMGFYSEKGSQETMKGVLEFCDLQFDDT